MTGSLPVRVWSLGVLAALALAAAGMVSIGRVPAVERAPAKPAVRLIVDFGDGAQRVYTALPWTKGMTVLDAMDKARTHPHGITFEHTGRGETAFLTRIEDLRNEGGGKRNWHYWVNTDLADRSFGAYALEPADVVTWKFAAREDQ